MALRSIHTLALLPLIAPPAPCGTPAGPLARPGKAYQDDAELVEAERAQADLLRRRGRAKDALELTDLLLEDDEEDVLTLVVRARTRLDRGELGRALSTAEEALELAGDDGERAEAGRELARLYARVGRADDALRALEAARDGDPFMAPGADPRDAWTYAELYDAVGDRDSALRFARNGAATDPDPGDWHALLAKARCQRRVGRLQDASQSLVAADRAARRGEGEEPEILTELGSLYFESEREIDVQGKRSAGNLFREALEIHPTFEPALLARFELHRFNRRRVSQSPEDILSEVLAARADSIPGLVAGAFADLEDGRLVSVRERLERLDELAPARRDVRTLHAALAWVEHRRDDCAAILEELLSPAPLDSAPERRIGKSLSELYRFAEAVDFLEAAVQRDALDYEAWTQLGKVRANSGDEEGAREALGKADEAAQGRRDAFRSNLSLVLDRMSRKHRVASYGSLSFSWQPDAEEVLSTYLVPYYEGARAELSERYGFTPGPTRIAVFRDHSDFSVRSVGFEGFPALGVCFGPVVTAVSPLSGLRGSFSWARTGFHEFSHVVHLGISNNRCPRWITEGLATWEEVRREPTWTRNMRRDLVDAYANDDLIPLRELNRAFRGPRILFGYYQGGLLCQMLIDEYGFPPMVDLLRAFDLGMDLDQAFARVFSLTPEEVDERFERFVEARIADLAIEPRWDPRRVRLLQVRLDDVPPEDAEARARWADDWLTVAYGSWQEGRNVDAERALQVVRASGEEPPRFLFLQGEMALTAGQRTLARTYFETAVERGGREVRDLLVLSQLQRAMPGLPGRGELVRETLELAVEAFPGFEDGPRSGELLLADAWMEAGDRDRAMEWTEKWLEWDAGEYDLRVEVARWHAANERFGRAVELYEEANEVDMFRRDMHLEWARALEELERFDEAAREYRVALAVPARLDPDHVAIDGVPGPVPPGALADAPEERLVPRPLSDDERAEIEADLARCLERAEGDG
ncbi:MAG: tetratricopeptide repeat protein [Planctomycetota bacterium]